MKKFLVKVNGTSYEVELEELKEGENFKPSKENVKKEEKIKQEKVENKNAGNSSVNSPMPGKILRIEKNVGSKVKSGDCILILEALKMENEILSPKDGIISKISVNQGDTVDTGAELAVIE